MRALSSLLHRLLGSAEEDPLTGAVDLSDSDYCFNLLSRNQEESMFIPNVEVAPSNQAAA